ncbi:Protein of unknown function (DUF2846) [Herbaspirillum sp. CF444]|uniref:DUF2846 domain-containing protein n=1 Tax=Herbaspirillum sp. CF444 TaxID=1144319 RepID=UPI0002727EDA|nr:DUF2846 domain-containing protein [Herbaspirillum sp. CF444]EJL85581.1 Protein of unknown function (DUF2846) [Herbaspirillum sp. CF444]
MKHIFSCAIVVSSLVGCASVPMGDPQKDAALKTFKAPEGNSGVYIYRNESLGTAIRMDVAIDGEAIGQTAAKTYFYKELPPGKHVITSKTENVDTLEIETKPGVLSYVWQEVKLGILSARSKLHLVSEDEGKKGVLETKLAESK